MNTTLFHFKDTHPVRVVQIKDQPWFVAADVCKVLSFPVEKQASGRYLRNLKPDEKNTLNLTQGIHRRAGNPNVTIISESGLYKLVMRSNKPEARAFQDWVTREVLPAIRKDGAYVMGLWVRVR